MGKFHDRRFPNETDDYRAARDELLAAETELRDKIEQVAELRRKLVVGGRVDEDYAFEEVLLEGGTRKVTLSELFGKRTSLLLYSFMFGPDWEKPCPSCTSFTDCAQGASKHLNAAASFAMVMKASPDKIRATAKERGWDNIRFLSAQNNDYPEHFHSQYKTEWGEFHPIMNVFTNKDGAVHHFWASETFWVSRNGHPRHNDLLWPLWGWLDLLPEGRGDFSPKLEY